MDIKDNTFIGAKYDAKAMDTVNTIAEALFQNALALGHLAKVLVASNVTIEAMLKVIPGQEEP